MLTDDEFQRCQSNPQLGKTWFKLTTDVFISFLFWQEIVEASDDAARKYYEETPEEERTSSGVTFVMRAAAKAKQQSFKGQFSKFRAVANPKLGDEVLHEVTKHWSNNEKLEMTLDKLQMIATAIAAPAHKVRWLQQWNSSSMTREVLHFPAKGFSEKDFEPWLNRASFWAGLEDGAVAMYSKTVDEDGLEISTPGDVKSRTIAEYVQAWRNQIWDYGFAGWFRGKESYSKTRAFEDHRGTDLAVKRVIYRYFMRELVQHDAVVKPDLPLFLTSWVDKSSAQCMYTMGQTRAWSVSHLKAGCWYIECRKTICPVEEEVVKVACDRADSQIRQAGSTHVEVVEEENEVDISKLSEKERNKMEKDAKKAADKAEREAARTAAKTLRETTAAAAKEARKLQSSLRHLLQGLVQHQVQQSSLCHLQGSEQQQELQQAQQSSLRHLLRGSVRHQVQQSSLRHLSPACSHQTLRVAAGAVAGAAAVGAALLSLPCRRSPLLSLLSSHCLASSRCCRRRSPLALLAGALLSLLPALSSPVAALLSLALSSRGLGCCIVW